jgi:transposase InsO family protein
VLVGLGIRQSVGRTGICFDNALAESFNAAVKVERVHRTVYPTRKKARSLIQKSLDNLASKAAQNLLSDNAIGARRA